ncbi:hypothetical protein ASF11_15810 [Acidovorax sp. Leaf76]|jgi:hypothetical protein|uniref:hypothetical protein n=1 Tax=unclassified Acidovorax TaxID=2684926 RepID=UPI0006F1EBCE|nr:MULTISPECIES: hypothetical protein [unclassified Acidovorax]KQO12501.1 hypothetical protein ASF11_15810 [Acidovorax sp. Leaf76]KQO30110.1 hypothetical protein ASF19_13490 [Acidovorax sp. Leaf84]KQS28821.1 hypothetical protein ASG27_11050 [Acidovorax sp. Leaf191]
MAQDSNIALARTLHQSCVLASAQIQEAQSLATELFPSAAITRADILGIAQVIAINHAALTSGGAHTK